MAEHTGSGGSVFGARLLRFRAHWVLTLCPEAREASGVWRKPGPGGPAVEGAGEPDPVRSRAEAGRRAQVTMRRYCVANRLNRLGTLTYRGEGQHDAEALRADVAEFFRRLRGGIRVKYLPLKHGVDTGGEFPYVWVAQWHPGGHGLHVHFAVARYIPRGVIEGSWRHGFVNIKLLSDLSTGSGPLEEARLAARYLARYVGSQLDDERRRLGLHRYDRSADEVIERASEQLGAKPTRVWRSDEAKGGWYGPPAVWAQWPA